MKLLRRHRQTHTSLDPALVGRSLIERTKAGELVWQRSHDGHGFVYRAWTSDGLRIDHNHFLLTGFTRMFDAEGVPVKVSIKERHRIMLTSAIKRQRRHEIDNEQRREREAARLAEQNAAAEHSRLLDSLVNPRRCP